ncbi:hypothetical protein ACKVMT_08595 [Halobacteriales archaeon Cl-PHB]
MSEIRQLTDDVYWIHGSHRLDKGGLDPYGSHDAGEGYNIHTSLYVVDAGDEWVLVNSGDYDLRYEFEDAILAVTDGAGVDRIFVHESHVPNSANVEEFRETWDAEVIFPGGAAPIHGFPDVTMWPQYGEEELAGRSVSLDQGSLFDLAHTTWIYDQPSGVFFTCEGFCSYHRTGDGNATSDELDGGIASEAIHDFYEEMLLWLKYADPERVMADMREVVDSYDISYVAPAHGHPVAAADLPQYMADLETVVHDLADSYEFKATEPEEAADD